MRSRGRRNGEGGTETGGSGNRGRKRGEGRSSNQKTCTQMRKRRKESWWRKLRVGEEKWVKERGRIKLSAMASIRSNSGPTTTIHHTGCTTEYLDFCTIRRRHRDESKVTATSQNRTTKQQCAVGITVRVRHHLSTKSATYDGRWTKAMRPRRRILTPHDATSRRHRQYVTKIDALTLDPPITSITSVHCGVLDTGIHLTPSKCQYANFHAQSRGRGGPRSMR